MSRVFAKYLIVENRVLSGLATNRPGPRRHYDLKMPNLRVQIVRFVDVEPQPGIVESQFRDAQGEVHSIIDKIPLFTSADPLDRF